MVQWMPHNGGENKNDTFANTQVGYIYIQLMNEWS